MQTLECCHLLNNQGMQTRHLTTFKQSTGGFTLIDMLVVLVIVGLLAGVALPRLYALSEGYKMASQRASLLSQIGNLGYRAYNSGKPTELLSLPGSTNLNASISLPPGWRIEVSQPIKYNFNGICSGGKITLIAPDQYHDEFQLRAPLCKPVAYYER